MKQMFIGFAAEWKQIERERQAKFRAAARAGNRGLVLVYAEAIDFARRARADHLRTASELR